MPDSPRKSQRTFTPSTRRKQALDATVPTSTTIGSLTVSDGRDDLDVVNRAADRT